MSESPDIFTGPWYPWYAAKALESEDILSLSLTEEGAYRRALDIAWKKGSIPADPDRCAVVIGKRCTAKVAAKILVLFTPMDGHPSRRVNNTLERVRKEQEEKHRNRVGAGKRGGRPLKTKGEKSIAKALVNPSLSNAPTDIDLREETKKEEEKREDAAKAASNPRAELWLIGKKMLTDAGEKNPSSIVGKMVKDFGEDAVIAALSATIAKCPPGPKEYMFKILQNKKNGNGAYVGQHTDTPERDYKCSSCFDKGNALVENPAADFGWETVPCPDCTKEAVAA